MTTYFYGPTRARDDGGPVLQAETTDPAFASVQVHDELIYPDTVGVRGPGLNPEIVRGVVVRKVWRLGEAVEGELHVWLERKPEN